MRKIYRGKGRDVTEFSNVERRENMLATSDTIIEVCGDPSLMEEMYEYCKRKKLVGYDTETTGLNIISDKIVLVQIGDYERQYLIWAEHTDLHYLFLVLSDPDIVKIGLNLKFDLCMGLVDFGFVKGRAKNVVDVMLTAQVLSCGVYDSVGLTLKQTGMGVQARHWLGLEIPKDEELRVGWRKFSPPNFKEVLRLKKLKAEMVPEKRERLLEEIEGLKKLREEKLLYAADDVCIPISLAYRHKPWIKHLGLSATVNLENNFLPVMSEIEARGIPLDREDWLVLAETAEQKASEARRTLDELFEVAATIEVDEDGHASYSRDKNYGSPTQLVNLIRDWMWENCAVEVVATNGHFKEALQRTGRVDESVIKRLFVSRMEPDPDNPGKRKKFGYPNQTDIIESTWDLYKDYLPPRSFVLPDTESDTLKFFKIIYEASPEMIQEDADHLPTTFGIPPALIDPILDLRKYSKSASTYGRNWIGKKMEDGTWEGGMLDSDGRLHPSYIQNALSTGRLSASPNSMNLPSDGDYRAAFKAREGYKMVGADYSQVEPRVIAHLSQSPTYMRVFWSERPGSNGYMRWCGEDITEELDLYTEVGKDTGIIPGHLTKKDTKGDDATPEGLEGRKKSKTANLGLGYGTGVTKFHKMLCKDTGEYHSLAEAKKIYDVYWGTLQVMKNYLDHSSSLVDHRSSNRKVDHPYVEGLVTYAETILGRKRFFDEGNPAWWTTGRNMPIQGSAGGDMLKRAAMELTHWAWDNEIEGGIINLIHDELLAEVREDQAEAFAKAMKEIMEAVGQEMCPTVPIVANTYISDFWIKD